MTDIRWGVWYAGPTAYESEEEARRQLLLAQMDVPARLIVDRGDGWRDAESGHRLGKLGLADDLKLLNDYAPNAPEEIGGALVSVTRKLEEVMELLERRRTYMQKCDERSEQALIDGNSLMSQRNAVLALAASGEVGRLERILYAGPDC